MADQLEGQRHELVQANRQLDERRHFIETVLSGVSAGVIGVDAEGRINLANRSACSLLAMDIDEQIGADISEVVPELSAMIGDAHTRPNRLVEAQISMQRVGRDRTLLVRLAADVVDRKVSGFVITFDDITELVAAQRKAAWSDVARRIAHEIKNPLTPIQLAAERLRRKYMNEITSDPETFSNCTDTIIRQVGDIGRMVDEFSAFARMPRPEMERENIGKICREALVLPRSAHPEIEFVSDIPGDPVMITGDSRQLSQVLTNLIQNAIDAIDGRVADGQAELAAGEIQLSLSLTEEDAEIVITDNGKGLPVEKRDRLTEPYMTTRTKGTGLGLAIVKTILEDHGGVLELKDRPDGKNGASIRVMLPLLQENLLSADESEGEVPEDGPEGGVAYGR